MKFEINITDWGNHVINYLAKNTNSAIQMLFDSSESHPGAIAIIILEDEQIQLDFAESPDFEGEILKLGKRVLRKKQQKAANKTNSNYSKSKRIQAAKKAWEKRKRL